MSEIVLSGQITAILPAQQGVSQRTGQPWVSQEYVLCHEPGQYPRSVCFRVFGQDKIQQMNIQMGESLTVHLNIDAKQGQKGYFNTIDCWKVERQVQQQAVPQQPQYQQPVQQQFPPQVNAQGQPVQQPAPGAAPFPPQQPVPQQTQQAPQGQPQQGGLPF